MRLQLVFASLVAICMGVSCVRAIPVKPVPPPVVPTTHTENMTVNIPGAIGTITLDSNRGGPYQAVADLSTGRLSFTEDTAGPWGETLTVVAFGYRTYTGRLLQCASDCEQPVVQLVRNFPPVPTRAQVTAVKLTFQGLTVCTGQLGCIPWFEPFVQALNDPADRQVVYAAKHAHDDTHLIIECFTDAQIIYNEAPFTGITTRSCEQEPQWFLSLVEEIIQNGFTPIITYDGDAGDLPAHGSANAARQAPILARLLQGSAYGDLNPYVLYFRGWDSVFYGSSPANIQAFGHLFRSLLPSGYLAIEGSVGHIPVGNGPSDYTPGGMMTDYDVIMMEFDNWPAVGDGIWQVLGRLLGPAYHRPADQPSGDDNSPPWYLASPSPRGPYVVSCFEWAEYSWTHGQLSPAQYMQGYDYYRKLGCPNF